MRRSMLGALVMLLMVSTVSAQSAVPNGAFVKDTNGVIWLVSNGARVRVPIHPAAADQVAAIPETDHWLVSNADGALTMGDAPEWATAAPAPAVPSLGRTTTYEGLTVTVLSVQRGWKTDNQFSRPKPSMEHFTVEIRVDNTTSAQIHHNPAQFELALSDGTRYDRKSTRDPALPSGNVIPGTPMRGWVTFEIPVGTPIAHMLWAPSSRQTFTLDVSP